MQIEINAQNIDDYGLDELTGNTKEVLLRRAAEAAAVGQTLWFKLPDHRTTQNVFDRFGSAPVDPADLEHGVNPIEQWDGKEIPAEADVPVHACSLPVIRVYGDEYTCPACRRKYYADDVHLEWVLVGEVED